jgi:hypothetical protein
MTLISDFLPRENPALQAEPPSRERRLVDRLRRYWTEISIHRGFVRLDDIDPWMIGDDWKDCLLVELRSPLKFSNLLAVGENLVSGSDRQMQGAVIADYPANSLVGLITSRLPEVLSRRGSLVDEGAACHEGREILYRCTLLPLSSGGTDIDHVLAAANYKFSELPQPSVS